MYRGSDSSDRQMGHGWSSDPHSVISFLSLTTPWNLYVFHVTIFFHSLYSVYHSRAFEALSVKTTMNNYRDHMTCE